MGHLHREAFIQELALRVLGSEEAVSLWLGRPNLELGGRSPAALLGDETGIRRLEELLRQLDDMKRHDPS